MFLLLFYLALALGVSFLCSILEAVLLSITPSFVMVEEKRGTRLGATLAALKDDIDRPLAAILSLNTIAHTVGAAGVGAQALELGWAVALVSAVLTVLILVFSEVIPKTLGATYWKVLAPYTARFLPVLIFLTLPFVWLAQGLTRLMSRSEPEPKLSRDELLAMADVAGREGIVDETESELLRNLLNFVELRASDIMTPRTVMLAADETTTVSEWADDESNLRFSRVPVYGKGLDDVTGYVLKHDVLLEVARDHHDVPLGDIKRTIEVVPAIVYVEKLLERVMATGEHIVLLVDEYGGTSGIVTLEDVVEHLLGLQIVDETDQVQDMQEMARKRWKNRAQRLGLTGRLGLGSSPDVVTPTGGDSSEND